MLGFLAQTGWEAFFGAQVGQGQIANSIWQKIHQFKLEIWSINRWWNWTANFSCASEFFLGEKSLLKFTPIVKLRKNRNLKHVYPRSMVMWLWTYFKMRQRYKVSIISETDIKLLTQSRHVPHRSNPNDFYTWDQFHQHVYVQFLREQIPKVQEDSQVISVFLRF